MAVSELKLLPCMRISHSMLDIGRNCAAIDLLCCMRLASASGAPTLWPTPVRVEPFRVAAADFCPQRINTAVDSISE